MWSQWHCYRFSGLWIVDICDQVRVGVLCILVPLDLHSAAVSLTCQVMLSSRACGRYTEFACLFVRSTADSLVCRPAIECHSAAMHSCGLLATGSWLSDCHSAWVLSTLCTSRQTITFIDLHYGVLQWYFIHTLRGAKVGGSCGYSLSTTRLIIAYLLIAKLIRQGCGKGSDKFVPCGGSGACHLAGDTFYLPHIFFCLSVSQIPHRDTRLNLHRVVKGY